MADCKLRVLKEKDHASKAQVARQEDIPLKWKEHITKWL